jgi:hypothetical protein
MEVHMLDPKQAESIMAAEKFVESLPFILRMFTPSPMNPSIASGLGAGGQKAIQGVAKKSIGKALEETAPLDPALYKVKTTPWKPQKLAEFDKKAIEEAYQLEKVKSSQSALGKLLEEFNTRFLSGSPEELESIRTKFGIRD